MVSGLKSAYFPAYLCILTFTISSLELNHTLSRLTSCQFRTWLLHLSTIFHSILKTLLFSNAYPDSSSSVAYLEIVQGGGHNYERGLRNRSLPAGSTGRAPVGFWGTPEGE